MKKSSGIGLLLIILVFSLCGCKNQEEEKLSEKVSEEIHYMESVLLSMLNGLNNISFEDYKVTTEKMEESKQDSEDSTSEGDSQKSGSEGDSTEEQSQSSGGSGSTNSSSKDSGSIAKLEVDSVLIGSRDPDWTKLKLNIEKLNEVWSGIVSDMYQIGANSEDILQFSNAINITITAVAAENKEDTMKNLANLYQYIPKYTQASTKDDITINLEKAKANVINAYSKIESEDWEGMSFDLQKAEEEYNIVINQTNNKEKQYNMDKVYILLKEFQNSLELKNKDIFYIKYKNLIQEMVIL